MGGRGHPPCRRQARNSSALVVHRQAAARPVRQRHQKQMELHHLTQKEERHSSQRLRVCWRFS
eukprot:scaffold262314_cov45-Prasinocladus_malaysianus.AAC.1